MKQVINNPIYHSFVFLSLMFTILISACDKPKEAVVSKFGGLTTSIFASPKGKPLFKMSKENSLLDFKQWVYNNHDLLGLSDVKDVKEINNLFIADTFDVKSGNLDVLRLSQTYRRFPVFGVYETITITSNENGEVFSLNGGVIDEKVVYKGLENKLGLAASIEKMKAWFLKEHDETIDTVMNIEYGAISERKEMVYRGEIVTDNGEIYRINIAAVDGSLINIIKYAFEDIFQHYPIRLAAHELGSNPESEILDIFHNQPGSIFGDPDENLVRLGDDRVVIYDMHGTDTEGEIYTAERTSPGGPAGYFWGETTSEAETINLYHKVRAAMQVIDPFTLLWDHAPSAPYSFAEPAPLIILNHGDCCGETCDALGHFTIADVEEIPWEEEDFPFSFVDYRISYIKYCSRSLTNTFHELGHYYDYHIALGVLGQDIASATCNLDTPDESPALRETVANMFTIYIIRKLYDGLDYELADLELPCNIRGVSGESWPVHSPDCIGDEYHVGLFDNDRPRLPSIDSKGCRSRTGYNQYAIFQAYWEFISGKICDENPPYDCEDTGIPPEHGLEAMLHGLLMGNYSSYWTFFQNMYMFSYSNYGSAESDVFLRIMRHHGIDLERYVPEGGTHIAHS